MAVRARKSVTEITCEDVRRVAGRLSTFQQPVRGKHHCRGGADSAEDPSFRILRLVPERRVGFRSASEESSEDKEYKKDGGKPQTAEWHESRTAYMSINLDVLRLVLWTLTHHVTSPTTP